MKITKVDVYMLDATVQRASRRPIIARVHTDEGIYGDGEAGIALGTGAPAAFGMVQDLARFLSVWFIFRWDYTPLRRTTIFILISFAKRTDQE